MKSFSEVRSIIDTALRVNNVDCQLTVNLGKGAVSTSWIGTPSDDDLLVTVTIERAGPLK